MRETHYEKKSPAYGIGHTRRNRILKLVGNISGKRILDVGCARGYLGRIIREKGNYVAGIEISSEAANEARKVLDEVHVMNIEQSWPESLQRESFDVAIIAEVLEHLFDPKQVVLEIAKVLKPNGSLIITTPNFMTWTNRLQFLFGRFKYQDQGMFDFGHIRWFTYRYLESVLKESGFEIEREEHIIFPGKLTKILKRWPGIFAFQFIVKARKI